MDEATVRAALSRIVDPARGIDIIAADQVKALSVRDGVVSFVIEVDPARGGAMEPLLKAAQAAVSALPGVTEVKAVLTAHGAAGAKPRAAPAGPVPSLKIPGAAAVAPPKPLAEGPAKMPGIGRVIAVASGGQSGGGAGGARAAGRAAGCGCLWAKPATDAGRVRAAL